MIVKTELQVALTAKELSLNQKRLLNISQSLVEAKAVELLNKIASNSNSQVINKARIELINLIRQEFYSLSEKQVIEYSSKLIEIYNTSRLTISEFIGTPFNVTNEFQAARLLQVGRDGTSLSKKIYGNNSTISTRLNTDIAKLLNRNATLEEIKIAIEKDYNISYNAADRLIRTESSKFYNQAAVDSYKAAGITQVEFLAEDDACEEFCQPNDGKIFQLGDSSNVPPLHPNCRCTVLPVIKE